MSSLRPVTHRRAVGPSCHDFGDRPGSGSRPDRAGGTRLTRSLLVARVPSMTKCACSDPSARRPVTHTRCPGDHSPSARRKRSGPAASQSRLLLLDDNTADIDLEADDLDVGFAHGLAKRGRREGLRRGQELHFRRLPGLADRDAGNAVQASSQRHFHGRRACRSGDAADLRERPPHAVRARRCVRRRAGQRACEDQARQERAS